MKRLLASLRRWWREWHKRRRLSALIAPQTICAQAEEMLHLTELMHRHVPLSPQEAQRLHAVRQEMQQLILLTQSKDFHRLPADYRLTLHGSLARSQEKMLLSMQMTHAPTERIQ